MPQRQLVRRTTWGEDSPEGIRADVAEATYQEDGSGRCDECEFCTTRGADSPYCELTGKAVVPDNGGCDVCEMDGSEF